MNDSPSCHSTFLIELSFYSLLYFGNFLYIPNISLLSNVLFETIVYILGFLVWCFYEIPECETEWVSCVSVSYDFSWVIFLLFFFLSYSNVFNFVL